MNTVYEDYILLIIHSTVIISLSFDKIVGNRNKETTSSVLRSFPILM